MSQSWFVAGFLLQYDYLHQNPPKPNLATSQNLMIMKRIFRLQCIILPRPTLSTVCLRLYLGAQIAGLIKLDLVTPTTPRRIERHIGILHTVALASYRVQTYSRRSKTTKVVSPVLIPAAIRPIQSMSPCAYA